MIDAGRDAGLSLARAPMMVRLVRAELPAREQARWQATLSEAPLVERRTSDDAVAVALASLVWVAPYLLVSYGAWTSEPPAHVVTFLRGAIAAMWILSLRTAFRAWRASRASWPSGRFFFRWGYAEIAGDVLRVVPLEELTQEIRGRWLGVGPIRLLLRAPGWSTTFFLRADEVEAVATGLGDAGAELSHGDGYREAPRRIDGPRSSPGLPMRAREIGWATAAALAGIALPLFGTPEAPAPVKAIDWNGYRAPYRAALMDTHDGHASAGLAMDLSPCTASAGVVSEVSSFLREQLASPALRADQDFIAPSSVVETSSDRLWARCSWHVDVTRETLLRTEARWGLERGGTTLVERTAVVNVSDAIEVIDQCDLASHGASVSPAGLAIASLLLVQGAIRRDLYGEDAELPADAERRVEHIPESTRACVLAHARSITIGR